MSMRELRDEQGHTWRVWEVHPGGLSGGAEESRMIRVRDRMSGGWVAFACVETGARFRVAPPPAAWHEMADAVLLQIGRAGEPVVFPPTPTLGDPSATERNPMPG
jgi:hypothetical protein